MANRIEELSRNEQLLADLLDDHAGALRDGADNSQELLSRYSPDLPMLDGLLRLARRLVDTLVPVNPSEGFVSDLRARLVRAQARQIRVAQRWSGWRRKAVSASRLLGGAVSLLALLALALRVIGTVVMIVLLITTQRRRPAAA